MLSSLYQKLTVSFSFRHNLNADICNIVRRSLRLQYLHLRFVISNESTGINILRILAGGSTMKQNLFSVANRLTFHGHNFSEGADTVINTSFPALRALALIDCNWAHNLLDQFEPKEFLVMDALMIKTQDCIYLQNFKSFVRGLKRLRELIFCGKFVYLTDGLTLVQHADTL
jgi:hypothetical protein